MSSSLITKKTIAKSFVNLMDTVPFQQISVRMIMDDSDIRRQTFYDHFYDKFDLTTWIFKQDFKEHIQDYIGYDPIIKILERFLQYLKSNRVFYQNALSYHDQNAFEETLKEQLTFLIEQLIESRAEKNTRDIQVLSNFIALALVGIITEWLNHDCKTPIEDLLRDIETVLDHLQL